MLPWIRQMLVELLNYAVSVICDLEHFHETIFSDISDIFRHSLKCIWQSKKHCFKGLTEETDKKHLIQKHKLG